MDNLTSILYMILIGLILLVTFLIAVFIVIKMKEKKGEEVIKDTKEKTIETKGTSKIAKEYEKKSIFDFMEFENVRDNMIIQKDGKRFLMAIECQGVNYDLMSDVEKVSTEQGFATFLNTLREPIQIYIQTRTINLESNIQKYKEKLIKIKDSLNLKEYKLNKALQQENVSENIIKNQKFEVLRERNLYEYGRDIIADTERMSLNKNVLRKKYYIIIRYFYEPTDAEEGELLSKEEISDIAFSNLYTRASSIIRVLSGIGIVGKTLNSFELVDLLYNAYNRDDSETFGIEKAIEAGYNEIYVDSQEISSKKIEALNKEIELKAQEKAKDIVETILSDREKEINDIENNLDDIILNLAKQMIQDEANNIPTSIKEEAIKKIDTETKEKGEEINGKKRKKESSTKRRAG